MMMMMMNFPKLHDNDLLPTCCRLVAGLE